MRRASPPALLLTLVVAGLVALLVVSLQPRRQTVLSLGVQPLLVAVEIPAGGRACQRGLVAPESFDAVRLSIGTFFGPGQPLSVEIVGPGGTVRARGRLAGGYPDIGRAPSTRVLLAAPAPPGPLDVCVANRGSRRLALFGNGAAASPTFAERRGRRLPADASIVLERRASASWLSLAPDMARRAALFRPGWVGTWTYWLLAALVLLAGPLLLGRAVAATGPPRSGAPRG